MNTRALHLGRHQLAFALARVRRHTGIVAHGLFPGMATALLVAADNGIEHRTRSREV
ncbi:MAG: hypothetical protein K0R44_1879 [Thermomicrobiales bacterium]|nr:hypothetical protein [Thermomicrobiales bacterium]